jgi:hypothetical protein
VVLKIIFTESKVAPAKKAKTTSAVKVSTTQSTKGKKNVGEKMPKEEPQIVELKAGKLVLRQKSINWDAASSSIQGELFVDLII